MLKKSVPAALIGAFRREIADQSSIGFQTASSRTACFDLLQEWQRNAIAPTSDKTSQQQAQLYLSSTNGEALADIPQLSQLGNYWLDRAIALDTIVPFETLDTAWDAIAARTPFDWNYRPVQPSTATDPSGRDRGPLWAVPYTWSSTAIAYRTDKLGDWQPRDWKDLWEAPELKGRIVLPDSPRETIGLALKALGASYNTPDPERIDGIRDILAQLHAQALTYSSRHYQQSLVLGDAWVAIGSSQDIANMPEFGRTVAAIVPRSGSALWADLWVRPRASTEANDTSPDALVQRWIEFCWQPEIAATLSSVTNAASPGIFAVDRDRLPEALRNNALLLPDDSVLAQSEFIQPLSSPNSAEAYEQLWTAMRSGKLNS